MLFSSTAKHAADWVKPASNPPDASAVRDHRAAARDTARAGPHPVRDTRGGDGVDAAPPPAVAGATTPPSAAAAAAVDEGGANAEAGRRAEIGRAEHVSCEPCRGVQRGCAAIGNQGGWWRWRWRWRRKIDPTGGAETAQWSRIAPGQCTAVHGSGTNCVNAWILLKGKGRRCRRCRGGRVKSSAPPIL